jgi:hypothetical protein
MNLIEKQRPVLLVNNALPVNLTITNGNAEKEQQNLQHCGDNFGK